MLFEAAVDLSWIQSLRVLHAITEAGFTLQVAPEHEIRIRALKDVFGMKVELGREAVPVLTGIVLNHLGPETRIGEISRPIVFPKAATEYCRSRWSHDRPVHVSFAGLLTDSRRRAIENWLTISGMSEEVKIPQAPSRYRLFANKVVRRLGLAISETVSTKHMVLSFSNQGRVFPAKAWNVQYYDLLLASRFVLCPSGDFGAQGHSWTYRFFESVLCGAIPVVEEPCSAYDGFRYLSMSDPIANFDWRQDDADFNYQLLLERTTIDSDELRAEVLRLLKGARHEAEAPRAAFA
ncbi:hypothetical protein GCM10007276_06650 [Agaricicola taiwanensis]|uniref:Exostosin GT47 domain-containing protein n=1 Tax=Agaricicola taiwanensis TaxID=591372 RepID=A0A8J2VP00_9RHOB|nr:hypothetical protein [Agaricicola taiwanensis]GGE32100.1 hypothetical protein GCM10007276_06650 [Agaricicola taiwanensis]